MQRKLIEGKIFDLQDKLEICEIALNEVNDCEELEPAYKDIIKAYREHIADLEEFLKEFKQHSLRNPIVEQVITETLGVVKDIWMKCRVKLFRIYGMI